MDNDQVVQIGSLPFDGNTMIGTIRGMGPRRKYIFDYLTNAGLYPVIDESGNIRVDCGRKGEYRLFSSHMDVDKKIENPSIVASKNGYSGVLDNAVGCYINMEAAKSHKSDQRAIYLFTASEEENPDDENDFARSAKDVKRDLIETDIIPELCVAVDITYPRLLVTPEELDRIYGKDEWNAKKAEEIFDANDDTKCYVDGIVRGDALRIADKLVKEYANAGIKIRDLAGWDETKVYSDIAPSFAVGPVCFGKFDEPSQRMPATNATAAVEFLKYLAEANLK